MYHNKNRLSLAVKTALGFTTMVTAGAAMAQEQSDAEEDFAALEEVIVTGSRIVNPDGFSQTSPVTVVGMEEIAEIGFTRVEDVLNQLPQIEANQTAFIANGSTGTANIDLRGMGANRTLVLLNGRRLQPGGLYSNAPDVNQIPTSMIERVEVLTGGASATYGADAVAGVVNFIMRKVNGVEFSMGASGYQHDNSNDYIQGLMDNAGFEYPTGDSGIDGKAYNFDLTIGGDFADGRGNASAYITYRTNEELRQAARDYSSCALNTAGTACGGSANAAVPNFFIAPITADGEGPGGYDYAQEIFVSLQSDSSLADYDGSNVYNYAPVNHFMRPDDRWSGGAFVDFEINEHAIAYAELGFADNRTRAQIAESGTFFFEPYPLSIDNPQFPDAFRQSLEGYFPGVTDLGVYIGKRNIEGGPRTDILQHTSFRIVGGLKGAINDNWDYDVSYLYGQTTSESIYINDFFASNVLPTVDGSCVGSASCLPYDVFTYGGVTPEAAAQLSETGKIGAHTSTTVINGYVTGDLGFGLPAGDIFVVGGFEYREEVMERIADLVFEKGLLLGQGGPTPSVDGNYSVNEVFAEANVPLLSNLPLVESLTLDLAYRWSDYSTSGDASTYRVGLDWAVTDWARVRTGYNRAVRAPNIFELFLPQNLGLWQGVDPCGGATPQLSAAECANTGVTPAQYGNITLSPADQYNALYGGNPNLDPEDADTFTAGVVFQFEPGDGDLQVSLDYWNIEIEDTIANIDPELMVTQCALNGILCDNIVRSGSGSLWQGQNGYVVATNVNLGSQHWEGVDLAASYALPALGGTFNVDLVGTYMLTKETAPLPTDDTATYDCVGLINSQCFPAPEWRHVASATYDSDEWWAVTARWRFYQDVYYDGGADTIANDNIGDESYFDATAVFRFMDSNDLVVGVNNLLDEEPPLVGGSLSTNGNATAGFYDTLGRYLFANVTFRY